MVEKLEGEGVREIRRFLIMKALPAMCRILNVILTNLRVKKHDK